VFGGSLFRINEWLAPGRNRIHFAGNHEKPLYAKLITLYPGKFNPENNFPFEVVNKVRLAGDDSDVEIQFDVPEFEEPFFDDLGSDAAAIAGIEMEARKLIESLADACRDHDAASVTDLLLPEYDIPTAARRISMPRPRDASKAREGLERVISDSRNRLKSSTKEVHLVIGKRSVLAYTPNTRAGTTASLFDFEPSSPARGIGTLRLVRIKGRWGSW
jgi:hypothetical protein